MENLFQYVSIISRQCSSYGQNYAIVCPNLTYLWRHSRTALFTVTGAANTLILVAILIAQNILYQDLFFPKKFERVQFVDSFLLLHVHMWSWAVRDIFTAVLPIHRLSVCLSICLSVCLKHSGIVAEQLNVLSTFFAVCRCKLFTEFRQCHR